MKYDRIAWYVPYFNHVCQRWNCSYEYEVDFDDKYQQISPSQDFFISIHNLEMICCLPCHVHSQLQACWGWGCYWTPVAPPAQFPELLPWQHQLGIDFTAETEEKRGKVTEIKRPAGDAQFHAKQQRWLCNAPVSLLLVSGGLLAQRPARRGQVN